VRQVCVVYQRGAVAGKIALVGGGEQHEEVVRRDKLEHLVRVRVG